MTAHTINYDSGSGPHVSGEGSVDLCVLGVSSLSFNLLSTIGMKVTAEHR